MKVLSESPVLVIELGEPDFETVVRALRGRDVQREALQLRDAREAYRYLFETPEAAMPAMIVLHAEAALADDMKLLRAVKRDRQLRVTPVLIVAGPDNSAAEIAQCYEAGANTCLRRDPDDATYGDTLDTVASYWLKTAVLPITALAL